MYGKIILGLMLTVAFAGLLFTMGREPVPLTLSVNEGKAPLAVVITGPEDYRQRMGSVASSWTGCDVRVNWGDGSQQTPSTSAEECESKGSHIYSRAGVYRIEVSINSFGTVEAAAWHGQAFIRVD